MSSSISISNPTPPISPFRPDILRGHVSLITGGGSGIGLEISRQLGVHGSAIVIMGRRDAVLQSAVESLKAQGIDALAVKGDVRSPEDALRVLDETGKKFGHLDLLVNCAAGNFLSPAEDLSTKGFRTVIDIDTIGTFNMSRAAYPLLVKSKNPSIINITATLHLPATQYQVHASAAKAAVDSLTRSLALEWGPDKIRVNGIAPGNNTNNTNKQTQTNVTSIPFLPAIHFNTQFVLTDLHRFAHSNT